MRYSKRWMVAVLILSTVLPLSACGYAPASLVSTQVGGGTDPPAPARVERLGGTGLNRLILSTQAATRLGIQTGLIRRVQASGMLRNVAPYAQVRGTLRVVPYAAVIYDPEGKTWVYTEPKPLTFVRAPVSVAYIDGDLAVLSAGGPPDGTRVVTVGVSELYGTELGVGNEP